MKNTLKMLCLHCDYFSYLVTHQTKNAEKTAEECKSCVAKDALVVFATVEKLDEKNIEKVAEKGTDEIIDLNKKLGTRKIIIFPFAHLSEEIGDAHTASKVINTLELNLKKQGLDVSRAPFGWEKIFSLTTKGHPLSESLKIIRP